MTWSMSSQLFCRLVDSTEKPGPVWVSQRDSADAIFIGCCLNMIWPWMSPVTNSARPDTRVTHSANRVTGRHRSRASFSRVSGVASMWLGEVLSGTRLASPVSAASRSFLARHMFRAIHQMPMAATKVPAVKNAPAITCGKAPASCCW